MKKNAKTVFIKAKWYNFETGAFIPENMKPRTLKTYEKHVALVTLLWAAIRNILAGIDVEAAFLFLVSNLHFTHHVNGKRHSKLAGLSSISTSALTNRFCLARKEYAMRHPEKNIICKYCYAITQQLQQIGVMLCGIRNSIILNNVLIPVEYLKDALLGNDLNNRIEAFGDTEKEIQARNYIRLCKAFPDRFFAAWSKNWLVWYKAFEKEGKPDNLTFVWSSKEINKPENIPEKMMQYVDHRFTVYDAKYIKEHGIIINCGGRSCLSCLICYRKNNIFDICEQKK